MQIVKGEPLRLPDGTMVLPEADPDSGSKVVTVTEQQEAQTRQEIERELTDLLNNPMTNEFSQTYKRTLADVDVEFARMNVIMLVLAYTMWGLDSYAISQLLNVRTEQVEALKSSDLYNKTSQELIEAIRYAEAATVHGYIASKSLAAARVVAASLTSPSGDLRLAAAKDILDRGGFRPADRVEHVMKFEDELRIRYVQDTTDVPTIDLAAEEL